MTFKSLKQVLTERLETLDHACNAESLGTPTYDEVCGRYDECKTTLDLVNRVTSYE